MSTHKLWLSASLLAVAVLWGPRPADAHVAPLTDRQMAHYSDQVVVATVERAETRWNQGGTLIETEYSLRVDDRLKGASPAVIRLTVPGGTLGGETQATCLSTHLEPGAKYLLFLGDIDRPALIPFTGGWQGVFRALPGKDGRLWAASGAAPAEPMKANGGPVEFASLVAAVRGLIQEVEDVPLAENELWIGGKSGMDLPAKRYDPAARPAVDKAVSPRVASPATAPGPFSAPDLADGAAVLASRGPGLMPAAEKYRFEHRATPYVVFNQLPGGFAFEPHDQYMMSYWNLYADIFRVSASPTGTWSWRNGVFDIAGFPSDSQMIQQFGQAWPTGALGVTFGRWESAGPILEADIALNPAAAWTTDANLATWGGTGVFSFDHVMLHELGHSWGLQHPWESQDVWWDSVMNYTSQPYMQARLCVDDVFAIRNAYSGASLRDISLSSYITQDRPGDNNAAYLASRPSASSVRAGGKISLSGPIRLENLGTDNVINPSVEVYLTPQRFSFTGAVRLKTARFKMTARPLTIWHLTLGTLTVPKSVKPGTYYLAFYVRDNKDKIQNNNAAWSVYDAKVTVTR